MAKITNSKCVDPRFRGLAIPDHFSIITMSSQRHPKTDKRGFRKERLWVTYPPFRKSGVTLSNRIY